MATPSYSSKNASPAIGTSPHPLLQHARPQRSFRGCSSIQDYDILRKLGEGTFGEVHQAKSKRTGAVVALKKILMHNEKDGFPITALREIKLLKLLDHKNILTLMEMAVEYSPGKDKRKRHIMYMVTPYMDHDLSGLLENPAVKFTEPQVKCYMMQLLEGLKYLHNNRILHRDMKAANLLINNKGILQIADFGLARHYDEEPPKPGMGGGEATREYTCLVVTRWYRPPELLLLLRKYTTAIDLWGVGQVKPLLCVFGEMLIGRPILAGESDQQQLRLVFDLVGTPTEDSMPGWKSLPGSQGLNFPPRPSTLATKFREHGSGAISLLAELLKPDWRKRLNAMDALKHPYFTTAPLPAKPGEIPTFEESHELDRRKFRSQQAAPPPAPKGGTVGVGPNGGWSGGPNAGSGHLQGYQNGNGRHGHGEGYGGGNRPNQNGSRYPPAPPVSGGYTNGGPLEERHPAWRRDDRSRPDTRLPPRPPPSADYDGPRSGRPRDMDRLGDRSLQRQSGPRDTYIPAYTGREERPRDDRRRRDDRDDRRHDRGNRLEYDDRARNTRTRSRSPIRERERDNFRDRAEVDRDIYRR